MKRYSLFFFLLFIPISIFADDVPAWLRQAASTTTPTYDKKVSAVAVYDDEQVMVDSDGKITTTRNYAVKILNREGKREAMAQAFYLTSYGKVKKISAWMIRPDGSSKEYDKKEVIDRISDPDDIYDEGRIRFIDGTGDVDSNYVFGYTTVTEEPALFYQDVHFFQFDIPSVVSRYTLSLPSGWKATSITFNHDEIAPQVNGTNYTWELRNLPYVPSEPMSPSIRNLVPQIAVNFFPDEKSQNVSKTFVDWSGVSHWLSGLHDPQVIIDDNVAGKARELTANATTELEKIQAIGNFVQNLQYISIDIGVGYGNGMRPRPSNLVLGRGYGDCKDKANLMRAMLKALKIDSYPIAIYSGDPTYTREAWVSPRQFNHCIIAVKVSDATQTPTVINHPKLGRLLIFDATDPFTPVGDLPETLQGSMALIIASENGGLSKMPISAPEFNIWDRKTDVTLTEDGNISGTIRENLKGQSSTLARGMVRSLSASDFSKLMEAWLTDGATGAKLIKVTPQDQHNEATFNLDVEFSAPRYGQLMQNRLLVFKPVIASRRDTSYLTEPTRQHPILLESNAFNETVMVNLPKGFVVDEMPDPVKIETAFGKYTTTYEVKDNKLKFTRSLVVNQSTIPVDKYSSVKDFYAKIIAAEQSPVVLIRK